MYAPYVRTSIASNAGCAVGALNVATLPKSIKTDKNFTNVGAQQTPRHGKHDFAWQNVHHGIGSEYDMSEIVILPQAEIGKS